MSEKIICPKHKSFEATCDICVAVTIELDRPQGTSVDGPAHYNGYEVLEAICNAGFARGFCLGNAVKYLLRSGKKGKDQEDLEKAQFYLNWYLERYEKYEDSE